MVWWKQQHLENLEVGFSLTLIDTSGPLHDNDVRKQCPQGRTCGTFQPKHTDSQCLPLAA